MLASPSPRRQAPPRSGSSSSLCAFAVPVCRFPRCLPSPRSPPSLSLSRLPFAAAAAPGASPAPRPEESGRCRPGAAGWEGKRSGGREPLPLTRWHLELPLLCDVLAPPSLAPSVGCNPVVARACARRGGCPQPGLRALPLVAGGLAALKGAGVAGGTLHPSARPAGERLACQVPVVRGLGGTDRCSGRRLKAKRRTFLRGGAAGGLRDGPLQGPEPGGVAPARRWPRVEARQPQPASGPPHRERLPRVAQGLAPSRCLRLQFRSRALLKLHRLLSVCANCLLLRGDARQRVTVLVIASEGEQRAAAPPDLWLWRGWEAPSVACSCASGSALGSVSLGGLLLHQMRAALRELI